VTVRIEEIALPAKDLLARRPHTVWISPTLTLAGFGRLLRIDPGADRARFERARWLFAEWAASEGRAGRADLPGPFAYASFSFDPDAQSIVVVPELVIARDHRGTWAITHGQGSISMLDHPSGAGANQADRPRFAGSSLPDHLWLEAVATARKRIEQGDLEKVVLARDHALWSKEPFALQRVMERLHRSFPECYTFMIEGLVGASPELLIRRHGSEVESRAMAGSIRRDPNPVRDDQLGHQLMSSSKDLHEHALAAASVGSALGAVCRLLDRSAAPELAKLANVQHLATSFRGILGEERHVLELVALLHPTAAVGGTPTAAALDLIRQLEGMDRGRYAGPVGVFDPSGDGEFAIALRCAEISGARARLFAGAGLVRDSVPEDELEETRLKLRAMLSVLE
jgi:menaquinone-specific isochorismate synthase